MQDTTAATSLDTPNPASSRLHLALPARALRRLALLAVALRREAFLAAVRRTAIYAGVSAFITPAFFFWVVISVEQYVPDMTFREFVGVPYVREFVVLWWFVFVLVVAALSESERREAGSKQNGKQPRPR